jgi:hypothetical protein
MEASASGSLIKIAQSALIKIALSALIRIALSAILVRERCPWARNAS